MKLLLLIEQASLVQVPAVITLVIMTGLGREQYSDARKFAGAGKMTADRLCSANNKSHDFLKLQ